MHLCSNQVKLYHCGWMEKSKYVGNTFVPHRRWCSPTLCMRGSSTSWRTMLMIPFRTWWGRTWAAKNLLLCLPALESALLSTVRYRSASTHPSMRYRQPTPSPTARSAARSRVSQTQLQGEYSIGNECRTELQDLFIEHIFSGCGGCW